MQRKANGKHIIFKELTDHLQSDHVALLTFLSSFSENHSSSAPRALLRGLTPPASPGKATQPATESAPQASFLSTLPELSFHPPACHFLDAPPGPSSQWVSNQLIFPASAFLFLWMESLLPLLPRWKCLSHLDSSFSFSRSNQLPNHVVPISVMPLDAVPSFRRPPFHFGVGCHCFPPGRHILPCSLTISHLHAAADRGCSH